MKIYLSYNIGDSSFSQEFSSFTEIDQWFYSYKKISQYTDSAFFTIEVREVLALEGKK